MSRNEQDFLRRWARRKSESANRAPPTQGPPQPAQAPPPLPPLDSLNFESDFGPFMRGKVEEDVKRAALKKLFSDPRFNLMDGLDVYVGDYSIEDPIPPGMLAQLEHAKVTLFGPQTEEKKRPGGDTELAVSEQAVNHPGLPAVNHPGLPEAPPDGAQHDAVPAEQEAQSAS
jgi:hypothetical protein